MPLGATNAKCGGGVLCSPLRPPACPLGLFGGVSRKHPVRKLLNVGTRNCFKLRPIRGVGAPITGPGGLFGQGEAVDPVTVNRCSLSKHVRCSHGGAKLVSYSPNDNLRPQQDRHHITGIESAPTLLPDCHRLDHLQPPRAQRNPTHDTPSRKHQHETRLLVPP